MEKKPPFRNVGLKKAFAMILFAGIVLLGVINFRSIINGFGVAGRICTPFFVGIVMAFILNMLMVPINRFLANRIFKKKKKLAKGISIVLAYLIFIAIIVALLAFVIPELVKSISSFVGNINVYVKQLEKLVSELSEKYELDTVDFNEILVEFGDVIKNIGNYVLEYIGNMVPHVFAFMSNIVSFLFNTIMAVVISANILVYKEKLISQISRTVKAYLPKWHRRLCRLSLVTADTFRKYVSGQCIEALILGMLCYIGMIIFRFDYALLISTVIAATALIPVAGAYIGGAVAFILLAIVSPLKAVLFIVYLVILQQIETNLIYPKVVGTSLELPGIWVIFAVTLGGGALGVVGIIFSVPIMSVIYKLVRESVTKQEEEVRLAKESSEDSGKAAQEEDGIVAETIENIFDSVEDGKEES